MTERVAIVGSRGWPQLDLVREYVLALPLDTIVVSGGARGVDSMAEFHARKRGLGVLIFCIPEGLTRGEFVHAAYARNRIIVENCDRLVAFQYKRSGGTQNSIDHAIKLCKPVEIFELD